MSNSDAIFTEEEMNSLYSILRSELNKLSVSNIRNTAGAAGFDVTLIPATSEARTGIGSRSEVMPVLDRLFGQMSPERKLAALRVLTKRLIEESAESATRLATLLGEHHYQLLNGTIVPVGILDARERQYLPSMSADNLEKAMQRLGSGDYTGAITSACGAVDSVLRTIYQRNGLGSLSEGYVQKVRKVFQRLSIFQEMEKDLIAQGLEALEAKRVVDNMEKATFSAAEVLQIYRHDPGDAHGSKPATRKAAYDALKWASAICGLLEGKV